MTTSQIIEEIERLPSKEKTEILTALLRSQTTKRQLSPDELVALADQMVTTKDPEEADRLEKKILAGFLRPLSDASHSTRMHPRAADGAPHQASSTARDFNFAAGAARSLAGYRSRSAGRSMV